MTNDTKIRVISSMEPDICTKMLRNLSEEHAFSTAKIACAFSVVFEQEASLVEHQSLQQKR